MDPMLAFGDKTAARLKTLLPAQALARLRSRGSAAHFAARVADSLIIPTNDATDEDRQRVELTGRGQFLVRQDRWDQLGTLIRDHDRARAATASGLGFAALLAYGARTDVVQPIEAALTDPGLLPAHIPRNGLALLDDVLEEHASDYGVALIVAEAHIDVGWAWRGQGWRAEVPTRNWREFQTHFTRAADILDRFDPFEEDSPALAAARCALLAATDAPQARISDDYEDLIDLDPQNPRHLRAYGYHLLPRWFGTYDRLASEAARTGARLSDVWGADGGYACMMMDALAIDPGVLAVIDVDRMRAGFADILTRRPDQHTTNHLAAYCAVTLAADRYHVTADRARAVAITDNLDWILRQHLREIHPLVWGIAGQSPDRPLPGLPDVARQGLQQARACIGRHFERDLRRGGRIRVGPNGLWVEQLEL